MSKETINTVQWYLENDSLHGVVEKFEHFKEGRRTYDIIEHEGQKYFVKTFREKGIVGHIRHRIDPRGKHEFDMAKRLLSFGIRTPAPLGYGIAGNRSYVLVEYIEGETLIGALKKGDRKGYLLDGLALLLQSLSESKIRHNDLHLENVLVSSGKLYLIDLHKMRIKRFYTVADEISNLSHALAMAYSEMSDAEKVRFFKVYGNPAARAPFEEELARIISRWIRRKRQRAYLDTTRLVQLKDRIMVKGAEDFEEGHFVKLVKEDKKVRLERFSTHIRKIYLNDRRLARAWQTHSAFIYMDNRFVPRAYYLKKPGGGSPGYIAMEDLKNQGEELDRFLDRHYDSMGPAERHRFVRSLAGYFSGLFQLTITHRDLKACNVFVTNEGGFVLLDVEDIEFKPVREDILRRMFLQLATTIPRRVSNKDRMRFFLAFKSRMAGNTKDLFKEIVPEVMSREIIYEGVSGLQQEKW